MRYTRELRERFVGDRELAMRYIGIARKFLGMLDNQSGFAALKQSSRRHVLTDGVVITVQNIFGQREIVIDVTGAKIPEYTPGGIIAEITTSSVTDELELYMGHPGRASAISGTRLTSKFGGTDPVYGEYEVHTTKGTMSWTFYFGEIFKDGVLLAGLPSTYYRVRGVSVVEDAYLCVATGSGTREVKFLIRDYADTYPNNDMYHATTNPLGWRLLYETGIDTRQDLVQFTSDGTKACILNDDYLYEATISSSSVTMTSIEASKSSEVSYVMAGGEPAGAEHTITLDGYGECTNDGNGGINYVCSYSTIYSHYIILSAGYKYDDTLSICRYTYSWNDIVSRSGYQSVSQGAECLPYNPGEYVTTISWSETGITSNTITESISMGGLELTRTDVSSYNGSLSGTLVYECPGTLDNGNVTVNISSTNTSNGDWNGDVFYINHLTDVLVVSGPVDIGTSSTVTSGNWDYESNQPPPDGSGATSYNSSMFEGRILLCCVQGKKITLFDDTELVTVSSTGSFPVGDYTWGLYSCGLLVPGFTCSGFPIEQVISFKYGTDDYLYSTDVNFLSVVSDASLDIYGKYLAGIALHPGPGNTEDLVSRYYAVSNFNVRAVSEMSGTDFYPHAIGAI